MFATTSVQVDVAQIAVGVAAVISATVSWRVRKDQKPNGGNSSRDAINRIEEFAKVSERRLMSIELTLVEHGRQLLNGEAQRDRFEGRMDRLAERPHVDPSPSIVIPVPVVPITTETSPLIIPPNT